MATESERYHEQVGREREEAKARKKQNQRYQEKEVSERERSQWYSMPQRSQDKKFIPWLT